LRLPLEPEQNPAHKRHQSGLARLVRAGEEHDTISEVPDVLIAEDSIPVYMQLKYAQPLHLLPQEQAEPDRLRPVHKCYKLFITHVPDDSCRPGVC